MKAALATLALAGLSTLVATRTASSQDTSHASVLHRTVSVSGEGIVLILPDQAIVRFGVVTKHRNPEEARARNAAASRDAMNAVRALGIDERKLQMESLRIEPERRYNQQTRNYDQIGFEAIRDIRVIVDDLDLLPTLIARVVQEGANRLHSVSYDLKDRDGVRLEALRRAALNARVKASMLAETLDAKLGAVYQIGEQGVSIPRPERMMAEMAMKSADAAPQPEAYASGEIEVRAHVNLTYSLVNQ